jgi:hypothetical protein
MKTWSDVFSSWAAGTPGAVCRVDGDISAAFPLCARAGVVMQTAETDMSKKDGRNLIDMLLSQSVRR